MKKNIRLNKQIIKALSVGISASMLLQPVSAMAAEVEETPAAEPNTETTTAAPVENVYDTAEDQADVADAAVEVAIVSSNEAVAAVTSEADVSSQEAASDFADVIDAVKDELAEDCNEAKEYIEDMEAEKAVIDAWTVSGNNAAAAANAAAETAANAAVSANNVADEAYNAVVEAERTVSENEQKMLDADTTKEAEFYYNIMVDSISGADATVTAAQGEYDDLKQAVADAEAIYNAQEAAYNEAVTALNNALAYYNEVLAVSANGETDDAQGKIEALRLSVASLKEAADAAYENLLANSQRYLDIAAKEALAKGIFNGEVSADGTWEDILDPVFEAIVRNYYVPDVLGGSSVKSLTWKKRTNDALNYCTVIYLDSEGVEHKIILNYRLANSNKSGGIVIFEKTKYLVFNKNEFNEDEIKLLDEGEVVYKNGIAVHKNAKGEYVVFDCDEEKATAQENITESNVGIDLSEVDENTKIVDISDNSSEEYRFENGRVVKVVTADVITTTFTGESLSGSEAEYSSKEAAKAAYVAKLKEIIEGLGEGESIVIAGKEYSAANLDEVESEAPGFVGFSEDAGYLVTGTYCEKFTDTVPVSGTAYGGWNSTVSEQAALEAYRKAAKEKAKPLVDKYEFDDWGLFVQLETTYVGTTIDDPTITASGKNKNYSGSVNVSYANVSKEEVGDDWALFDYLFLDGDALKQKFAAQGKVYLGKRLIDGTLSQYTIYYVDSAKAENVEITAESEDKVLEAFKAALGGNTFNEQITSTAVNYKYGYNELEYFIKLVSTENLTVSRTEWATILGNTTTEWRNDKFNEGNILLAEYNPDGDADYVDDNGNTHAISGNDADRTAEFRSKVDEAARLADMYQNMMKKIADAQAAIDKANEEVNELEAQILALKINKQLDSLDEFKANLQDALNKLNDAIKKRDDLLDKLDEIEDEFDDKIDDLTPDNPGDDDDDDNGNDDNIVNPGGPGETSDDPGTDENEPEPGNPTPGNPAPAVPGPAASAAVIIEDIPDDQVALTDAPAVDAVAPVEVTDVEDEKVALAAAPVTIGDDATPLASIPEEAQMNWWWLLIILILGATGAEMYRRYQAKKKAAEITKDTEQ